MPPFRLDALEDRLTPAGELDPTFGSGGVAIVANASASAVAGLTDGSVLVGGWAMSGGMRAFAVAKLRPDGSPDTSFGTAGVAMAAFPSFLPPGFTTPQTDSFANTLTVQADGRIVVAGSVPAPGIGLARFTPGGQLDPTFGSGGTEVLFPGQRAFVSAAAVQADGRIVLAGRLTSADLINTDFLAARITPDGAPDPTFSGDGLATVAFDLGDAKEDSAAALALQPDGRLLLAGSATSKQLDSYGSAQRDIAVVRLLADGTLDPSFDGDGKWTLDLAQNDFASAVALRPDGRIVIGGTTGSSSFLHGLGGASFDFVVTQLQPDGSADGSFGSAGRVIVPVPDPSVAFSGSGNALTDLAVQATGQIVLVGAGPDTAVRLTRDGALDVAFGTGGVVSHTVDGQPLTGNAVLVTPLGRIVVAGSGSTGAPDYTSKMVVARLVGDPLDARTLHVGGPADGTGTVFSPLTNGYGVVSVLSHFPGFTGEVRTATADVTGDGVPDFLGGAGPGGGPQVAIFDGASGGRLAQFSAFESAFTGGVFVAAADLDGDGKAEVIVTPDRGGGPVVTIYSGAKLATGLGEAAQIVRFLGIADDAFRGGARPALGDINGDGSADLIVAAGFLGGPRIAVFDGKAVLTRVGEIAAAGGKPDGSFRLVGDFFAFEDTLRNGAFAAAGDFTGDGKADLAFGGGPGGAARVRVIDGARLLASPPQSLDAPGAGALQVGNFFAGDPTLRGGVHLAARDANADGRLDLVTGSGEGEPSRVRLFLAATLLGANPTANQEFDPYGATLPLGVFVG